ncbi:MAG: FecR domain-containing protein [Mangrovibacterium sp.]|nr:FecR domain-containing protein [Mangrovibacterium sp.]
MDQIKKYIYHPLFLKWVYESDEHTEEYWNDYLEENPEEKQMIMTLKDELKLFRLRKHKISQEHKSRLAQRIAVQLKREKRSRVISAYRNAIMKYAAVFILAVAVSSLFFYSKQNRPRPDSNVVSYTTAIAENGQISKLILPDSSVVWLNSGTQIKYPTDFAIERRDVFLDGQAFFQIKRNTQMPFKVFCRDVEVRVLGTSFNINAYPEEQEVKVVLETGKVELMKSSGSQTKYTLEPGQKLTYHRVSDHVIVREVELDRYVKWKDGVLIFRKDPMSEVVPVLQRKYNIDLEMNVPSLDKYLFTATITDESLNEIIKSIAFTCRADFKIIKNADKKTKVIITNNN